MRIMKVKNRDHRVVLGFVAVFCIDVSLVLTNIPILSSTSDINIIL